MVTPWAWYCAWMARQQRAAWVSELDAIGATRKDLDRREEQLIAQIANHDQAVRLPWDECVATGMSHSDGPYGMNGEQQCRYCGRAADS